MATLLIVPFIDLATFLAVNGVKTAVVTTPLNAPHFSNITERARSLGYEINILITKFPSVEAGLPHEHESFDKAPSPDLQFKFFTATTMLREPPADLLQLHRPDCIVAYMFFPWATHVAAAFGILTWLNSMKPNSVVYICFGSVANFSSSQLLEIAAGLEASGEHFIWAVRKEKKTKKTKIGFQKNSRREWKARD